MWSLCGELGFDGNCKLLIVRIDKSRSMEVCMRIEHVALYVNDLEEARGFFKSIWLQNQMTVIII